jgi:hypothetical protein
MRDKALAELNRALEENSITLCLLDVDPKMDALRCDPRFAQLRHRAIVPNPLNLSNSSQKLSAQA